MQSESAAECRSRERGALADLPLAERQRQSEALARGARRQKRRAARAPRLACSVKAGSMSTSREGTPPHRPPQPPLARPTRVPPYCQGAHLALDKNRRSSWTLTCSRRTLREPVASRRRGSRHAAAEGPSGALASARRRARFPAAAARREGRLEQRSGLSLLPCLGGRSHASGAGWCCCGARQPSDITLERQLR